jgi:hypothetical protein
MNIHLERSFEITDSTETVSRRLRRWSQKYGLTCTSDSLGNWEYRRGTHLQASYTFDVRKVPTTVTITMVGEQPAKVHCSILVKSWLSIATRGETSRVEEQIELLEAYVRGFLEE